MGKWSETSETNIPEFLFVPLLLFCRLSILFIILSIKVEAIALNLVERVTAGKQELEKI